MNWIKYPEQKPTKEGPYLIYRPQYKCAEESWFNFKNSCFTYDGICCGGTEDYEDADVSHWMKMPKGPYELE